MSNYWIKLIASMFLGLLFASGTAYADLKVFACEPEWAALAKSLGGKHLTIYNATTNQQDPHHIQARPSLIAKARQADLLVCTGAELEIGWLPLLLRKSGNTKIQQGQQGYFMATDHVALLGGKAVLDRSQGDVHALGNPHVQVDPMRILKIARKLGEVLMKLDPAHQADYQKKLTSFTQQWQSNINRWDEQTQKIRGKSIVVHHDSWIYLQQWLGLKRAATLEPKPGIPPSSVYLSQLLSNLKQESIYTIIHASYQSDKAAKWLSQKTDIPSVGLDAGPAADETLTQWFDRFVNQLLRS